MKSFNHYIYHPFTIFSSLFPREIVLSQSMITRGCGHREQLPQIAKTYRPFPIPNHQRTILRCLSYRKPLNLSTLLLQSSSPSISPNPPPRLPNWLTSFSILLKCLISLPRTIEPWISSSIQCWCPQSLLAFINVRWLLCFQFMLRRRQPTWRSPQQIHPFPSRHWLLLWRFSPKLTPPTSLATSSTSSLATAHRRCDLLSCPLYWCFVSLF